MKSVIGMETQNLIRGLAMATRACWDFIVEESIILVLDTNKKDNVKNNEKKRQWQEHDRNGHINGTLTDRGRLSFGDFLDIPKPTTSVKSTLA